MRVVRSQARGLRAVVVLGLLVTVVASGTVQVPGGATDIVDPPPASGAGRPNIVLFLIDNLDGVVTPYWEAMPQTRELVAEQGRTFTQAFAPTPLCCPARATILTGLYGHNTGVLANGGRQGGIEAFQRNGNETRTFPIALQGAGYRTMLAGKYLNGYEDQPRHIPPGWTEWYAAASGSGGFGPLTTRGFHYGYNYFLNENGALVWYGDSDEDYGTDVVARKTVEFLERSDAEADDAPFFAYVSATAPHLPIKAPRRYEDHPWLHAPLPVRPNAPETDLSDKPSWLRQSAYIHSRQKYWATTDYRNRMGSLLAVDDLVANVIHTLERTGELDNTYLFFVSDNGVNLWAHGLINEEAPYDESLRVPAVVAGPGVVAGNDSHLVDLTDLAPTFLELAGLSATDGTDGMDGRSLAPLLRGESPAWRHEIPVQYAGRGVQHGLWNDLWPPLYHWWMVLTLGMDVPAYRGVRTDTHLYVEWYDQELFGRHEEELYDMRTDPWQLDNLLATPEGRAGNAALLDALRRRTGELVTCRAETCRG